MIKVFYLIAPLCEAESGWGEFRETNVQIIDIKNYEILNYSFTIVINNLPEMQSSKNIGKLKIGQYFSIKGVAFIIFLALIIPFSACTKVNTAFFDKVLNDFDTNSYFVALDIKSSSYKGRVVIENKKLYQYLNKTKGLTKEKYMSLMRRILVHHKVLKIKNKEFPVSDFLKVSEVESVIQIANQGVNYFVAYYFDGVVLNYGITDNERNAIINQLFFWNYLAKIDKITGNLIIG